MMNRHMRAVVVALALTFAISGCSVQRTWSQRDRLNAEREDLEARLEADRPKQRPAVEEMAKPWVSKKPIPMTTHASTPSALRCRVSINPPQPISVLEFAQTLTSWCGIPIRVTNDALRALAGDAGNPVPPLTAAGAPLGGLPPAPGSIAVPAIIPNSVPFKADFNRAGLISDLKWSNQPLDGLLDVVVARLGISWKYADGTVYIYHTDTRTYDFSAINRTVKLKTSVQSGTEVQTAGQGGGSGGAGTVAGAGGANSGSNVGVSGGSKQNTEVEMQSAIVTEVEKTLKELVTPGVGRVTLPGGLGMVAVTDTPEGHARISAFLDQANHKLTRQVKLFIEIYTVELTEQDQLDLDLSVVYKKLDQYQLGLGSSLARADRAITGSAAIPATSNSRWAGSKALFDALSTQGLVKSRQRADTYALNLSPAPIQIAESQGYKAGTVLSQTANVGQLSSPIAGSVTTGFNMTVLPQILSDDEVIINFTAAISPKAKIRPIGQGDGMLEVPDTTSRTISQQVKIRNQKTFLMSGYEVVDESTNEQGIGNPTFWGLGGSSGRAKRREVMVIAVTPEIEQ